MSLVDRIPFGTTVGKAAALSACLLLVPGRGYAQSTSIGTRPPSIPAPLPPKPPVLAPPPLPPPPGMMPPPKSGGKLDPAMLIGIFVAILIVMAAASQGSANGAPQVGMPPCYGCASSLGSPVLASRPWPGAQIGTTFPTGSTDPFSQILATLLGAGNTFQPRPVLPPWSPGGQQTPWFSPLPSNSSSWPSPGSGPGILGQGGTDPFAPATWSGASVPAPLPSTLTPGAGTGALPGPFAQVQRLLGKPYPASPAEITPQVADHLLEAMGFYKSRSYLDQHFIRPGKVSATPIQGVRDPALYRAALRAMIGGWIFTPGGSESEDLDGVAGSRTRIRVRDALFTESQLLAAALQQSGSMPLVDWKTTRSQWTGWVTQAAATMNTEAIGVTLSPEQEIGLIRSLLDQESNQHHWGDFQPLRSNCGAIGGSQLMMGNWKEYWSQQNPYEPGSHFQAFAMDMNKWMTRFMPRGTTGMPALQHAVAMYNGGPNPGSFARTKYAPQIMARWQRGTYQR